MNEALEKKFDEDEILKKKVLLIADFVIETGSSTRKTAKYISENHFKISNCTVSKYLNELLPKLDAERFEKVKNVIKKNTPATMQTITVRKRMYESVSLLLKGYTVKEIALELNETESTIYNDIQNRFMKLETDEKLKEDVKKTLRNHSIENLCNQSGNAPYFDKKYFENHNVERENGRFKSFPKK